MVLGDLMFRSFWGLGRSSYAAAKILWLEQCKVLGLRSLSLELRVCRVLRLREPMGKWGVAGSQFHIIRNLNQKQILIPKP